MQIVIDVPEELYKAITEIPNHQCTADTLIIKNGTPLEQEESYNFAKWVANEIFDEYWEYNQDAFAEIACRKLAKLGIVRAIGGKWELVEPQAESEDPI